MIKYFNIYTIFVAKKGKGKRNLKRTFLKD